MQSTPKRQPRPYIQVVTVTAGQIQAKQIQLEKTPVPSMRELTTFVPDEGIGQKYGIQFIIEENLLKWDGLGLDGFLLENDRIEITYFAK